MDSQTHGKGSTQARLGGLLAGRGAVVAVAVLAVLVIVLVAAVLPAACSPAEKDGGTVPVTQNGNVISPDEGNAAEGDVAAENGTDAETDTTDPASDSAAEETATSTPRELWAKGTMPYLYQIDPQWSDTSYSGGTLAEQGCGPTALCMVYIYLTGDTSYDPAGMADFATQNGYATEGNGSSWALMTDGAAQLGVYGQSIVATADALRYELESGRPVICIMNPGTFTEVGHYIVLERMTEDGKVVVHDSNSVGRSMRTWDLDLICSEAAGAWSFSA